MGFIKTNLHHSILAVGQFKSSVNVHHNEKASYMVDEVDGSQVNDSNFYVRFSMAEETKYAIACFLLEISVPGDNSSRNILPGDNEFK